MLHLTGGRQAHIELCIDDGFFIPTGLSIMTIRINDAASASAHKFRKFRYDIALTQVRRIRTASDNHISIYKETFPLDCNVLNSGLPFWIVIGVWRNINGDSLLIERYPSKRHIAFPTDHAADWSPRCFSNREIILIRISHTTRSEPVGFNFLCTLYDPFGSKMTLLL